jgi:aminomethyltransferase
MKKTVLNQWHKDHGGDMVEFAGWEMPIRYETGIIQEHLTTRRYGGLFDVSHMGRFLVYSQNDVKDAISFLQHVLTNNAESLDPGQSQYTIIPNEKGGAIDDAYLYKIDDKAFLLVVNASNKEKDWEWFQTQLKNFPKTSLEDKSEEVSMIALQGPETKKVLEEIIQDITKIPDVGRNNLSVAEFENEKLIISRTGYTGEPVCFELFIPNAKSIALWEKILDIGKKHNIISVGLGARDSLRLEAGLPLYGHELGVDIEKKEIPIFAIPLAKYAVSFSKLKGDFIGKEALQKQFEELKLIENKKQCKKEYLSKRIRHLSISSMGVGRQGDEVYIGEKLVGHITSGTMVSYWKFDKEGVNSKIIEEKNKRTIGLAYIDSEIEENQKIIVKSKGRTLEGIIVERHLGSEAPPYARPIFPKTEEVLKEEKSIEDLMKELATKAVQNHKWRQKQTINLIPSEQTPSQIVRLLTIMDPSGRYAEHKLVEALGNNETPYYQGTEFILQVEEMLNKEMAKYLGCSNIESRVISGQQANKTVFSALVDYKNRLDKKDEVKRLRKVMNNHLGKGGHLSAQPLGALKHFVMTDPTTEKPAIINFPVRKDNPYKIDLEETAKLIEVHNPELIILGKSMVLHPEPVSEIRKMIDTMQEKPVLMYDMAHVLGLIGPYFQEPFKDGVDIVTGSTHKTFFGPQRGIIASNWQEGTKQYEIWEAVQKEAFPGSTSNHHLGTLLGLLMAAYEMNVYGREYQKQVITNAKAFAKALKNQGFKVEGDPNLGYTETHQVILNVGYAKGPEIAEKLEKNNIIVNYQSTPYDEGFSSSSALRIGIQEMTRFGMKEKDFEQIANYMKEIIIDNKDVNEEITNFRKNFTEMQYCMPKDEAKPLIKKLVKNTIY